MSVGLEPSEKDKKPLAPLLLAAQEGDVVTLIHLLDDMKCDIETKDAKGRTALYFTVVYEEGSFAVVDALLSRGANVNVTATDGRTLLVEACVAGWDQAVRALIEYGADSDTPVLGKLPAEWALHHKQDHIPAVIEEGRVLRFKKELARGIGITGQTESVPRIRIHARKQTDIKPGA
jgi:ankyrin repeat protein